MKVISQLIRFDKPIGTLLLLWPTLTALWLATSAYRPMTDLILIFILGTWLMRSAGCIINDIADRKFDAHVWRTQGRPLASGMLTVKSAIGLFILLLSAAAILVCLTNWMTIKLAIASALIAMIYPFCKRFTHYPQFVLGIAFGCGIPMAFAASDARLSVGCWLLFTANFFWTVAYDTMYAMADIKDDKKIGVKSTAIAFGQYDKICIGLLQLFTLCCLFLVGQYFQLHMVYFFCLFLISIFFVYQQYLIRHREPKQCFAAFLHNQWVGLVLYLGVALERIPVVFD